jgi:hypothetical protein
MSGTDRVSGGIFPIALRHPFWSPFCFDLLTNFRFQQTGDELVATMTAGTEPHLYASLSSDTTSESFIHIGSVQPD